MSSTSTMTETEHRASTGAPPRPRHLVEKRPGAGPGDVDYLDATLCGEPWDALFVAAGRLCDACAAEFRRRHPGAPLPGGGA